MKDNFVDRNVIDLRFLDGFLVLAITLYARVLTHFDLSSPEDRLPFAAAIAVLVFIPPLWIHNRRKAFQSPSTALLVAVLCTIGFGFVGNLVGLAMLWLAIVNLVFAFGSSLAIGYIGLWTIVTFSMHAFFGNGVIKGIWEATALGLLMFTGLSMASLINRASELDKERSHAFAKLKQKAEQDQELVINQERARIASTLHDGLGHKLTAVCMSLDFVSRAIASRPDRAVEEVIEARKLTSEAIDDMRKVVRAMSPVRVEGNPLETIRTLAESFSTTSLQVKFVSDITHLPEAHSLLALRFAQEALTNVVRHSNATEVKMTLHGQEVVTFEIRDNGTQSSKIIPGFGIRSLSDHATTIGASISTDLDDGFAIRLTMPQTEMSTQ